MSFLNKTAGRCFVLLLVADFISSFGSAMSGVAILLYIYSRTNSLLLASLFSAAILVPRLVLTPFVGRFRWRSSYRSIFMICELASALLFSVLLLDSSVVTLFVMCAAQCVPFFVAECFRADLLKAISDSVTIYRYEGMSQVANMLVQVCAPMVGGYLLTYVSVRVVFVVDVASFVLAALVISMMGSSLRPSLTPRSLHSQGPAGGGGSRGWMLSELFLRKGAFIYWGGVVSTIVGTLGSVVTIVYVRDVLHRLDFHYSILLSVSSLGAILGVALTNTSFIRERIWAVALLGNIIVGVVMCCVIFRPGFWMLLAFMFLSGVGGGLFTMYISTQLMLSFDQDQIMQRYAYFTTVNETTRVAANPLAAGIERLAGPIYSLVLAGVLMLGLGPFIVGSRRHSKHVAAGTSAEARS